MKRYFYTICLIIVLSASTTLKAAAVTLFPVNRVDVSRTWGGNQEDDEDYPHIKFSIDMPTGNDVLSIAVRKWIASSIHVEPRYKDNADQLINAYTRIAKRAHNDAIAEYKIYKVYETNTMVSFELTGFVSCCECNHGTDYRQGITFRKSDGKPLGKLMFKKGFDLNIHCISSLKKYYEVKTNQELLEALDPYIENLGNMVPKQDPWITEKGINLQYEQYEAGALGELPCILLPIQRGAPYFSNEIAELINQSNWSYSWPMDNYESISFID